MADLMVPRTLDTLGGVEANVANVIDAIIAALKAAGYPPSSGLTPPVVITGTDPATSPLQVIGAPGQQAASVAYVKAGAFSGIGDEEIFVVDSPAGNALLHISAFAESGASGAPLRVYSASDGTTGLSITGKSGTSAIPGEQLQALSVFDEGTGLVAWFSTLNSVNGSLVIGNHGQVTIETDPAATDNPLTIHAPGGGSTLLALTSTGALTLGATTSVKGDLVVGGASGVLGLLHVGADGTVPIADSTQPLGIRWGADTDAGFATPAILLGTAAAPGVATTTIRSDATVVAFDATAPTSSAVGDAAATGAATVAARRDHTHGREAFATPAIALGTAAAAGAATTLVRSDATIVAFDATVPVTQAFGDAAAVGVATVASRRDHKHGMPASPATTNFNAGVDQTGSRNITGTNTTNGARRRRCFVTVSLNGAAAGAAAANYTTTVGATTLTSIEGAKVAAGLTQAIDFQISFAVDPGATYNVNTVLGTGASAALVKWIEVDE